MKPRVLNKHRDQIPSNSVYIGRPSKWGNPFTIGKDGDRDEVCQKYNEWLDQNPALKEQAREELRNKNLICYCAPHRCHGDILLQIANEPSRKPKIVVPWIPIEDGITHINMYSKGRTELGRYLSNFANIGFEHEKFGRFSSVEAFWYWASTGKQHENLRLLSGYKAKEEGRKLQKVQNDNFHKEIQEVIELKIKQNPGLLKLFKESNLPFTHYYVYGDLPNQKAVFDNSATWLSYFHNKLRDRLKGLINDKDLKVIIAGSRDIEDYQLVSDCIEQSGFNIGEVVCGMAKGVDLLGKRWADERHIPVKEFPADWDLGKRAGYIRNYEMGKYADVLIAIRKNNSKGTSNMIEIMRKLNKAVYVLELNNGQNNG